MCTFFLVHFSLPTSQACFQPLPPFSMYHLGVSVHAYSSLGFIPRHIWTLTIPQFPKHGTIQTVVKLYQGSENDIRELACWKDHLPWLSTPVVLRLLPGVLFIGPRVLPFCWAQHSSLNFTSSSAPPEFQRPQLPLAVSPPTSIIRLS